VAVVSNLVTGLMGSPQPGELGASPPILPRDIPSGIPPDAPLVLGVELTNRR